MKLGNTDSEKIEASFKKGNVSATTWVIMIIMILVSVSISVIDIIFDVADAAADVATGGAAGVITTPLDLLSEVILELVQIIIITAAVVFLSNNCTITKVIMVSVVVAAAIIDVVLTIFGIFPLEDIVETGVEGFTELAQNIVLFVVAYSLFSPTDENSCYL